MASLVYTCEECITHHGHNKADLNVGDLLLHTLQAQVERIRRGVNCDKIIIGRRFLFLPRITLVKEIYMVSARQQTSDHD
jgi:hypothetical protein